jgi:hypothetical protein
MSGELTEITLELLGKEYARVVDERGILQKKLDITMKALDDILEFKRTGYFGLSFDVWQIIQKAMKEIEEIK